MYYDTYYKLTADPFRLSPDHRFSFGHPSYAEAKAYLEYALYRGEGFIIITGGPGTGKTTLINEILAGIGNKTHLNVATLNSTQLEGRDLLHMVAASFGLRYSDANKATVLLGIQQFLTQQGHKGRRSVLIVDEAQGLSSSAVEELRQLANLQLKDRLLLQVFLVGQEALRDLVRAPGMEHLNQRIVAASHLEPLSLDQTVTYIEHRLRRVGWRGDPKLSGGVLRLIHKFSGGVPRRINLICSRLFLHGGMEGKHEFLAEDALSVIEDLKREYLLAPDETESAEPLESGAAAVEEAQEDDLALPRNRGDGEGETSSGSPSQQVEIESAGEHVRPHAHRDGRGSPWWQEDADAAPAPRLRETLGRVVETLEDEGDSVTLPPLRGRHRDTRAAPAVRPDTNVTRRAPRGSHRGAGIAGNKGPDKGQPRKFVRPRLDEPSAAQQPVPDTRLKGRRWAGMAFIALLGGLAFAIGRGMLDSDRAGSIQALTKRVDDAIARVSGQLEGELPADRMPQLSDNSQAPADSQEMGIGDMAESSASVETPGESGPLKVEPPREEATGGTRIDPGFAADSATIAAVGANPGTVGGDEGSRSLEELPLEETDTTGKILRSSAGEGTAQEEVAASETPRRGEPETAAKAPAANGEAMLAASVSPQPQLPESAAATPATPAQQAAAGVETDKPQSQAALEAERERLSLEAKQRFAQRLEQAEPEVETAPPPAASQPTPSAVKTAEPAAAAPADKTAVAEVKASEPKTSPAAQPSVAATAQESRAADPVEKTLPGVVKGSVPKSVPKIASAPPIAAAAAVSPREQTISRRDRLKSALLQGEWTSAGNPASLLPSDVTLCKREIADIICRSVPRNVNTKYGEALYKVEATLQDFTDGGEFQVSYRTLVRLLDGRSNATADTNSDSEHWQISVHAMSCRLIQADKVSCRDEKGVTRDYSR